MSQVSALALMLPLSAIVTADDGGVGKTTFAVQMATAFKLAGAPLDLYQLDTKEKLAAKTGQGVVSLTVASAHGDRGDELSPSDVLAPWYRAVSAMPDTGRSTLLEVGGANAPLFHVGLTEVDLQEDVETMGLSVLAFVVVKASEDGAKQTVAEVKRLERNLPGARLVIVRNEVAGCPLAAAEYLEKDLKRQFLSVLKRYPSIRIPRVRPRSMAIYERLHVTPDVVVSWHENNYAEAIRQTGRPRDEAKVFVKDIAAWSSTVQDEILRVLPMLEDGGDA